MASQNSRQERPDAKLPRRQEAGNCCPSVKRSIAPTDAENRASTSQKTSSRRGGVVMVPGVPPVWENKC